MQFERGMRRHQQVPSFGAAWSQIRRIHLLTNQNNAAGRMYVCSFGTLVAYRAGVFDFRRLDLENVRSYRAMASLCRLRATLDPENGWRWIARADRWEALA